MEGDLVLPPGHKQRELISIHSLRMEGDLYPYGYSDASDISIHSLRMEGDTAYPDQTNQGYNFNPLPPHGGRPEPNLKLVTVPISIHSLRMEGDSPIVTNIRNISIHFNPLPPHGGRLGISFFLNIANNFNPLPPHGGRPDAASELLDNTLDISIHSLRMEGDYWNCMCDICGRTFQSTPSAWRETCACITYRMHRSNFNPLPPHGGRQ